MKCKVVNIKIPLYDYDDKEVPFAMPDEDVEEILAIIKSKDDVAGYSIYSIEVAEEDIDI